MANNRRHATLTIDGTEMEDDYTLFLIQNSQTGGSMLPLAPGASLDDGLMDIGILKKMTRRDVLKAFGMLKVRGDMCSIRESIITDSVTLSIETQNPYRNKCRRRKYRFYPHYRWKLLYPMPFESACPVQNEKSENSSSGSEYVSRAACFG